MEFGHRRTVAYGRTAARRHRRSRVSAVHVLQRSGVRRRRRSGALGCEHDARLSRTAQRADRAGDGRVAPYGRLPQTRARQRRRPDADVRRDVGLRRQHRPRARFHRDVDAPAYFRRRRGADDVSYGRTLRPERSRESHVSPVCAGRGAPRRVRCDAPALLAETAPERRDEIEFYLDEAEAQILSGAAEPSRHAGRNRGGAGDSVGGRQRALRRGPQEAARDPSAAAEGIHAARQDGRLRRAFRKRSLDRSATIRVGDLLTDRANALAKGFAYGDESVSEEWLCRRQCRTQAVHIASKVFRFRRSSGWACPPSGVTRVKPGEHGLRLERPERRHLRRSTRSVGRPDAPPARRTTASRCAAAAVQPAQQAPDVGRQCGQPVRRSDPAPLDSRHRRAVGITQTAARRRRARGVSGVHGAVAVREHRNRDHHVLAGPDVLRLLRGEAVPRDRDVRLRAADRSAAQTRACRMAAVSVRKAADS